MPLTVLVAALLAHQVVDLSGTWEVQKAPDADGAPPAGAWKATVVPGRTSVEWNEQLWYRRQLSLTDGSFRCAYLRLWGAKFAPRVLIDGTEVGQGYDGYTPTVFNVPPFFSPGDHTLHVVCHSFDAMTDGEVDYSEDRRTRDLMRHHTLGPVGSQPSQGGLWEDVELILTGDLYIPDAFVTTSYRSQRIAADVTVRNETASVRTSSLEAWVEPASPAIFVRGDANGDRAVDISDGVTVLMGLFQGAEIACRDGADGNDDGDVNIADAIYLLQYLFAGGQRHPEHR